MNWEVEYTDEFGKWWNGLSEAEQEDISATAEILMERGPDLPFPYSSGVAGSKHAHMRELRAERRQAAAHLLRLRPEAHRDPAYRR
ncbi:MAG TPA: type II toxin-antitoxin system RelE/ParE family toxin [Polyangiaceae bacterium]|nr:type II toxin-antitoxin system RelE/ParE family toxin [Polyangiaceae bacterium]